MISQRLNEQLDKDESLLWTEKPNVIWFLFETSSVNGILSSVLIIFVMAYFAYWRTEVRFIAVFIIGSMLISTLVRLFRAFGTTYAVTSKRLIILHPTISFSDLESYYPLDIDYVRKRKLRSGKGSIVFSSVREKSGKRTETVEKGFFAVKDADTVEALILKIRTDRGLPS